MRVFRLVQSPVIPSCLYTHQRRCCPTVAPVVISTTEASQCVSCLAVVSTRTRVSTCYMRLPRCCGELRWHIALTYSSFHFLFHILLPRCQNLLVFSAMSLCYAYAYTPLCISTSVAYLPSGTIRHILTARCLSAAYPGIQQMVLYLAPLSAPFAMSCPFANLLNVRRRVIIFIPEGLRNYFSEFGKVDACTIVRDADGKSRGFAFLTFEDPASVNAVMVREHFLDGKAVRVLPLERHPPFLTKPPFAHRSTPNVPFHARSIYETRGISSEA